MQTLRSPQVLAARVFPRSRVATWVLVMVFAGLTAIAAQWRIPLPFTPVPITGQTFAVLLAGAVLGMRAGAASQLLYLALGAVGLPVFTGASGGWRVFTGATAGYLVGFVVAAAVVGRLAERKHDRHFSTTLSAFVVGSFLIYGFGVAGLVINAGMSVSQGVLEGVAPFVLGDMLKAGLAGVTLPLAWRLIGER